MKKIKKNRTKWFLTAFTFAVSAAIIAPPIYLFYNQNSDPVNPPQTSDAFYELASQQFADDELSYYEPGSAPSFHDPAFPENGAAVLANDTFSGYLKNQTNLVFPTKTPLGTTINGYGNFFFGRWNIDPNNQSCENIVFPAKKQEGTTVVIDNYCLTSLSQLPAVFPKIKYIFIGSGITHIGSSSLGLGENTYSVWFDHESIDDLKEISADWYKSDCGAWIDGNLKRIVVREGQDKAAWATKIGQPQDIIFYPNEI